MVLNLTVALPGLPALEVGLSRLRADIQDWRAFWTGRFRVVFQRWVLAEFAFEGQQSGSRWAPLSPLYAIWKARNYPGKPILQRTGALKASLTNDRAPHAVYRATASSLEAGSTLPYAMRHQLGVHTGRRRLPQRPPLRVNQTFMAQAGAEMNRYIEDMRRARLGALSGSVA